jgi:ATP-dependent protease ClpP protease subunit
MVRERLNSKGLYLNVKDNISLTYYLTSEILDSSEYHDFVELAINLSSEDSITLLIDSPGGYLSGAQMIITGLNSSEAQSMAVVIDMAASAATIIALACDDIMMTEYSHFMIHAVAFGSGGKLHEVASHTEFTLRKSKELIASVYKDFLTPDEIQQVIDGKDMYFDDEETMLRWSYVIDYREAEIAKTQQEHLEAHIGSLEKQLEAMKSQLPQDTPKVKPKAKPKAS